MSTGRHAALALSETPAAVRLEHEHGTECPCAAHGARKGETPNGGVWSALLPILACAICPACVATYAKLLSIFGVGLSLSETQHLALLSVAIGASVGLSAFRSWRSQRVWPLSVALLGASLVGLGHLAGDLHELEWIGVGVLLVGGLSEHFRLRRQRLVMASS